MQKSIPLVLGLALLALAACSPSEPDPEQPLPPEQAGTDLPDLPGGTDTGPGRVTQQQNMVLVQACSVASVDGLCNVRFGMTEEQARKAYAPGLKGDATENTSCYYLTPEGEGYGRAFMMVDGTMQRIDVRERGVETLTGAQIGMPLSEVEEMYARTERTPNKYAPANEDLRADLGDGFFAIFETDNDGNVRAYRIGQEPAVSFVEGCA